MYYLNVCETCLSILSFKYLEIHKKKSFLFCNLQKNLNILFGDALLIIAPLTPSYKMVLQDLCEIGIFIIII